MSSHAVVELTRCPNCDDGLNGAYCAKCGQKVAALNPTFHDLLHDIVHEFLHIDGKIFRSVRLLLTRPGFLSCEHFAGRRARYISPIRLYLIFSVLYFAIAALAPPSFVRDEAPGRTTAEEAAELKRLGFESEEALQEAINEALTHWVPRVMFVLVPLFALLVRLVIGKSGRNYPQHLYFALHVHAAAFALLALVALARYASGDRWLTQIIEPAVMICLFVYLVLALRRAYGGTTAQAVRRTLVLSFLYAVAITAVLAGIVMPLFVPAIRAA
jgi:hypothetical protein